MLPIASCRIAINQPARFGGLSTLKGNDTMKLKTIQAFALIALPIIILIGAVTGDFDTAELLMYTAIFVGLTAVHITTEDNI
jgi:hypothetical protein